MSRARNLSKFKPSTTGLIADNTITNAMINSSAAIAKTKLASLDIVNADVNANAAIVGSKLTNLGVDSSDINAGQITRPKLDTKLNQLEMVWVDMVTLSGANHTHQIIDEYGTRANVQNGNNGPGGRARIKGETGTGNFRIKFQLGTLWGWSELHLTSPSNYTDATKHNGGSYATYHLASEPSGAKKFFVANNGSNNIRYYTYWNGSSSSSQTISGGSSNTMNIWRSDGTLYWYDTSTTHTIATSSTDNFIVYCGLQSPSFVRLLDVSSYSGKVS